MAEQELQKLRSIQTANKSAITKLQLEAREAVKVRETMEKKYQDLKLQLGSGAPTQGLSDCVFYR